MTTDAAYTAVVTGADSYDKVGVQGLFERSGPGFELQFAVQVRPALLQQSWLRSC